MFWCALIFAALIYSASGQSNDRLNVTGIRLTDGNGPYGGRVELRVNGIWGTICSDSFDMNDAKVLCRMMNLSASAYTSNAQYGRGSGPIFATNLGCYGGESHIKHCNYDMSTTCTHYKDVSIICTACGLLNVVNSESTSITSDGTTLSVTCKDGFYINETTTSQCSSSGIWQPSTLLCKPISPITDIRLANGLGLYDGRLEIKINETWGDVCSNSFTQKEADAICNMLFNLPVYKYYTYRYSYLNYVYDYNTHVHIDELDCYGSETDIQECNFDLITSCSTYRRTFVTCNAYPLNITNIRLTNGTGSNNGRVELLYNKEWGTICNAQLSTTGAITLCRMMNSSLTWSYKGAKYGSGTGTILIGQMYCDSYTDHINNCTTPYRPPDVEYCDQDKIAALICTDCGQPTISNGEITSSNGSIMTVTCNTGYVPTTYTIECLSNGTWSQNETCEVFGYPLNITDMRLADGVGLYDGRLEVQVNGTWGTVCSNSFSASEARAICNMMFGSAYRDYTSYAYKDGTGTIFIDKLDCRGTETHINQCKYNVLNTCNHYSDVDVVCNDNRLNITDIRLVPGPYHGRVEINVNDTWGTICDNAFEEDDGIVICRMLNGLDLRSVYGGAHYEKGKGPVHIDRLSCSGNEPDLNKCSYIYDNSCGHSKDASVLCYGPDLNITGVRLADGTGPYDGRAEIEVNGTWGTICDRNFDINDADAFCDMLGLRGAQYFTGARHGKGTGPVHIDEFFCDAWATDLKDCPYLFMNDCGHERDASVVCNECGQPDIYYWDIGYFSYNGTTLYADCAYYRTYVGTLRMTCDNTTRNWITEGECQEYSYPLEVSDIRLVNGNSSSDGRVEIKSMDTWGTICHDGFGMNEAHTICRMLGMWPAVHYYKESKNGAGTGPIFVDNLHCGNNVTHINNCSYDTYDNCSHDNDISVACLDCGDPTPLNGMINSTMTKYATVVEVSCEDGYRLNGNETIVCEISGQWNDRPYCQYIDCQSPKPENGAVNSTSTTNGTLVSVTCNTGYNLSGDAIIMCQSNDQWTDYPTCTILDCGVPTTDNADVELPSNTTTYDSIAVITCKHGYLPGGSKTVKCLETGKWDEIQVCAIVDCGDPTPSMGSRNDTNTTYGTVVEITCNDELEIKGNSTIVCQADGTWSDNPVCDANDCGIPSLSNGHVDVSNGTTTGFLAKLTCNKGYDLSGPSVLVCHSSGWNDTSECQLQDCGAPTVINGKLISNAGTTYGETATIECNEGYEMEGDYTISCEDGGRWSSETVCVIKDCGSMERPNNGIMSESNGTVFNSTARFYCDGGYLLVGESKLLCQSDGKWSSDAPSCVRLGDIGESCVTDNYCKTEGAVCRASKCVCKTGVHDSRTDKCDTMPLYPYGSNESDIDHKDWKQCANMIQFTPGLPFFGRVHTRIFVCPHGVVSFGKKYNNPTPPKNKNKVNDFKRDMIAPFHAHFKTGNVYYRSYDVLNSYETMKERAEIGHIEERVRQFADVTSFEASFILIATWENVFPEGKDFDTSESEASTIQLVLVSNGEMTYCYYIYPNGLLRWISDSRQYAPVWVGYYSQMVTPFTHHNSFTPAALALDTNTMHRGVSGVVFKTLVRVEDSVKNNNISCIKWYQDNKHEKQHIDLMNSWLPQCPCDISLARWDPWFWRIDRWRNGRKNFTCVDMLPGRIYRPYGKSCCYDYRTSLWVDERPIAGGFYRYHPENAADHYKHDILPKEMCCTPFTPFSKFFYDLRPTGTCYRESPYNFGSFWGDPHFRTLDGLNFTFNGLGEYILLQIQTENNTFTLQARTERAIKEDGNLSDATVFSAFAAMDETNASVHVELNRAKKGISLNISVTVEMLSLSTIVPKKFHNVTSGLLGNYNGNPEDDFTLPNGTQLPSNLTERNVFSYGQNWAIDGENSAFFYPDGKNHSDYHNATYVPRFLDEADGNKRLEAEKACNGSENIECVFDYVFTENKEIAAATNLLKGNAEKTKNEMGEVVPSLVGCAGINSTVKQTVTCPLTIEDGSNITFLSNNVNATFNKEMNAVSYYQANDEPVDLRVVAINQNGRSSPVFIVSVLLCTGCNGRGQCTDAQRDDTRNTDYFKYTTCECQPEYDGSDCENVFDGCAEDPCSLGRNCTSLNATKQKELNRTYVCDVCPVGFMSNDSFNETCRDVNECLSNPCHHKCTNAEGSYECTCMDGYRVDTMDKHKCADINECEDLNTPHNCTQNCTNTEGSFNCSCYNGYKFVSGKCSPDNTTDKSCSRSNCSQTAGCMVNDKGLPVCFCDNGFELTVNNSCKDIDECSRNACPQYCSNFNGGFNCSCFTGYKLEGSTTCTKCDAGTWGDNCQNECQCTGEGVKSCDPVKGCICEDGWQGDTCDEDINECNATKDVCDDPRKVCHNSPGSFKCDCLEGFKETRDGKCEDIDECSVPSLNSCDQICKNNLGSYSCECETGYTSVNSTCDNIDECALKTHNCEQVCDDNPGSYNCYCYFGYTLNDDRRTCTKLSDPCWTVYNLNCSHYCFISTDHAECRCQDGYFLGFDDQTCTDVDECTGNLHTCDSKAECKNVDGSYTCECPVGSTLENDGRTCSDCDEFHYGKDCAFNCSCLHGRCNRTQGCECESGWQGNNCDEDVNECGAKKVVCSEPNEECVNTLGSATCGCVSGYKRNNSSHCVDVDECSDGKLNTCEQKCVNTPGGYKCECQKGFLLASEKCHDIDECENKKSDCEQLCENTLGSYRCYCEDGFKLNQTDRVSCTPASGCSNNATCGRNSICFHKHGKDNCRCINGYHNESGTCKDIDECRLLPKPCSQNCTNNNGSYTCSCRAGYYLTKDLTTCLACEAGTYGDNCSQNCTCNVQNSESCDHIDGSCKCKTGWNGTKCDEDIDECKNTTLCPNHSKCNNSDGGYDCICDLGYFKTSSGSCLECDDTHYGENCAQKCACVRSNTGLCNHTNGKCECKEGWKGKNCSENVDECHKYPNICTHKENSKCADTKGSYKCICNVGFYENGDKCTDIDECSTGKNDCKQQVCENAPGNYTCKCKKGYQGFWSDCKACSSNKFGENCSETCSCHPANTIKQGNRLCDGVTGSCTCMPNWKGEKCDEDVDECENGKICDTIPNSGCVNTDGWYRCDCYRGFKKVEGKCIPDEKSTTTPLPVAAVSFNFNLHITDINLPDSVDLKVSTTYNKYHYLAMDSLKNYYQRFTTADFEIRITDIRKGSLIFFYVVQYKEHDVEVASAFVKATKKLALIPEFQFAGVKHKVDIKSESFDVSDGMCTILQSTGTCNLEDCVEENGVAKCKSKEPLVTLPGIIGISVGGGVIVLVIAIVTVVCLRRRRNSIKRAATQSAEGRPLPDVPNKKMDINVTPKWQDIATGSTDPRYLTWKTMLTNTSPTGMTENMYDELYMIPRAQARRTARPIAKDNTYF